MSLSGFGPGGKREQDDYYPTSSWHVERLLEKCNLPGGRWLEPCAGNGNIIKAINRFRKDVTWDAVEIQERFEPKLKPIVTGEVTIGDYSKWNAAKQYDVTITNPPFSLADEFIMQALTHSTHVAMLLRGSWVYGDRRATFLRRYMPDVYVIPNRGGFGNIDDSTEYCWYVWGEDRNRAAGKIVMLDDTSKMERMISDKSLFD